MSSYKEHVIEKFNGENFHLWKLKMSAFLKGRELWDIVEKGCQATEEKTIIIEKQQNNKAIAAIVNSLDDQQLTIVSEMIITCIRTWYYRIQPTVLGMTVVHQPYCDTCI